MKNQVKLSVLSLLVLPAMMVLNSLSTDAAREYVLGEGDVIEVIVRHNQDLSRTLSIRPDGKISFPSWEMSRLVV